MNIFCIFFLAFAPSADEPIVIIIVLVGRWAGEPREEEGHVGPEAGETGERGERHSGEPGQHELEQQGAVGGSEEQDWHRTDTVKSRRSSLMSLPSYQQTDAHDDDIHPYHKNRGHQSLM